MPNPPKWFMPACVAALLWNIAGLGAVLADLGLSEADLAALPEAQRALYEARPGWSVIASLVAVCGGTLGALGLVLRRRWTLPLLVASLAGLLVQDVALFVVVGAAHALGSTAYLVQGTVLVVAVALLVLARRAGARGWLRPT